MMRRAGLRCSVSRRCAAVLLALVAAACAGPGATPPPGYGGSVPSPEAQRSIYAARGESVEARGGRLPDGRWEITQFGVVPNPASPGGKGPVVLVRRDGETRYLPVNGDLDVEDLLRRARAEEPLPSSELSESYRAALGIR